jgi:hypothetical protein
LTICKCTEESPAKPLENQPNDKEQLTNLTSKETAKENATTKKIEPVMLSTRFMNLEPP